LKPKSKPREQNGDSNMRVVIDTNTVISGLLWHGAPRTVLDLARAKRIRLYTSPHLLLELDDVLYRPKFAARIALTTQSSDEIVRSFAALCTAVDAPPLPRPAAADPDDDAVLACAVAAHAEAVVSGDRHLLALSAYAGIPILDVHEFLQQAPALR
jgi:putative PIN family toxin of toxin-antitoxin system